MGGIIGVTLIFTAVSVRTVTIPLLITSTLGGSYADLGIFAGLAAALELPFMVAWGYALRWLSKHTIIIIGALLYAVYLVLISRAGSVTEILWLQLLNGPATAALLTIPISYLQDAIKGRVGLSTSLLDVSLYRRPSRYAPSDAFGGFAAAEFGDARGVELLTAVSSWVGTRLVYVPGSSGPTDGSSSVPR